MGFGTLFIGYFLILNITYYSFTDIIAALIMLLGLYKLSTVNKHFKLGTYSCIGFSCFALVELITQLIITFIPSLSLLSPPPSHRSRLSQSTKLSSLCL